MPRLTAATIVQDEARYLPQWVEFHIAQGFDHFLIYDNWSCAEQEPARVLWPYQGLVEVVRVPLSMRNRAPSVWAMRQFPGVATTWLWAGSVDEYFWCANGTVSEFLRGYETMSIAALNVNWVTMLSTPTDVTDGLVIERFATAVHDPHRHVKTIARQGNYSHWGDPHSVEPLHGTVSVNELHHHQHGPFATEFTEKWLLIHHYRFMSRAEYDAKMSKGRSDIIGSEGVYRSCAEEHWQGNHAAASEQRPSLVGLGSWLRQRLLERYGLL